MLPSFSYTMVLQKVSNLFAFGVVGVILLCHCDNIFLRVDAQCLSNVTISSVSPYQFLITWQDSTECHADQYHVSHHLVNRDQCGGGGTDEGVTGWEDTTSPYAINVRYAYSTYNVTLRQRVFGDVPGQYVYGESYETLVTSLESPTVPTTAPSNVIVTNIAATVLNYTWDAVPCGSRGGALQLYQYTIRYSRNTVNHLTPDNETSIGVGDLLCNTRYGFRVRAQTASGFGPFSDWSEYVTTLDEAPGPVNNLAYSDTTSQLSWTGPPSNTCAPLRYEITYHEEEDLNQCQTIDDRITIQVLSNVLSQRLSSLHPHSIYRVNVTAWNRVGLSSATTIMFTTPITDPSAGPSNLLVTNSSSTMLSFSWGEVPCRQRNGQILEYAYRLVSADDNRDVVATGRVTTTYIAIGNLAPCSLYRMAVFARTDILATSGRPVSIEAYTSAIAPEEITNLQSNLNSSSSSFLLSWSQPSSVCPTTHYLVTYKLVEYIAECPGIPHDAPQQTLTTTSETLLLSVIQPYSVYSVNVTAVNDGGNSSVVQVNFTNTKEGAPSGPPQQVSSTSVTAQSITISWGPPICVERNGVITHYTYGVVNQHTGLVITENTTLTSVDIFDLTPNTLYGVTVAAWTSEGQGPYSESYEIRTNVIPAPENLSAIQVRIYSITLQWSAPDLPNSIIMGYTLQYWQGNKEDRDTYNVMNVTVVADKQRIQQNTIYGLTPAIQYYVRVVAETTDGLGAWSDPIPVTTLQRVVRQPQNLIAIEAEENSITLAWDRPIQTVISYTLKYRLVWVPIHGTTTTEPTSVPKEQSFDIDPDAPIPQYTVGDLDPSSGYIMELSASSGGTGNAVSITAYTAAATDIDIPTDVSVDVAMGTSTTVPISFTPSQSNYVSSYLVGIRVVSNPGSNQNPKRDTNSALNTYEDNQNDYIAAEMSPSTELLQTLIVGDAEIYGDYFNAPLQKDMVYAIRVASVSRTPESCYAAWGDAIEVTAGGSANGKLQSGSATTLPVVIAVVVIIAIILIIVIITVIIRRKKKSGTESFKKSVTDEEPTRESTLVEWANPQSLSDEAVVAWANQTEISDKAVHRNPAFCEDDKDDKYTNDKRHDKKLSIILEDYPSDESETSPSFTTKVSSRQPLDWPRPPDATNSLPAPLATKEGALCDNLPTEPSDEKYSVDVEKDDDENGDMEGGVDLPPARVDEVVIGS